MPKSLPQMVVKNGDESHGIKTEKRSPTQQTKKANKSPKAWGYGAIQPNPPPLTNLPQK